MYAIAIINIDLIIYDHIWLTNHIYSYTDIYNFRMRKFKCENFKCIHFKNVLCICLLTL